MTLPIATAQTAPAPTAPVWMDTLRRTLWSVKPQDHGVLAYVLRWFRVKGKARTQAHRLQVVDRASLGDKGYLAVVQVDGRRFLLGGAQNSISLLTELKARESFASVLEQAPKAAKPRTRRRVAGVNPEDGGRPC